MTESPKIEYFPKICEDESFLTGTVCPARSTGAPPSKRPILGPTTAAPTRATIPPTAWTTPLPAKS